MVVDLQQIAGWITVLGVIAGVIISAYKLLDKYLFKRFAKLEQQMSDTKGRISDVETWTGKQQEDITEGAERDRLIINGVLACLKGLSEMGRNGPVTEAIKEINDYVSVRAHKTVSR